MSAKQAKFEEELAPLRAKRMELEKITATYTNKNGEFGLTKERLKDLKKDIDGLTQKSGQFFIIFLQSIKVLKS